MRTGASGLHHDSAPGAGAGLRELFPQDEDYRFHLTLRRAEARDFFAATSEGPDLLAQRREWLRAEPEKYAALRPEGGPFFAEWAALVRSWKLAAGDTCAELGCQLEPDFLLLAPGAGEVFRLAGGALVFPTSWALADKLGRPMDEIHAAVPGLNRTLGPPIRQFLGRIRPGGTGYARANWGLTATPQLNLHPSRPRPALAPGLDPARTWLRVEHQILMKLGESGGLVFGIRIAVHALDQVLRDPVVRAGFHRAVRTMPRDLAAYKGMGPVQDEIAALSGRSP